MTYKSEEFRKMYNDGMDNSESVLYLLSHARKEIYGVARKLEYALSWRELLSVFAGYTYGMPAMKRKIIDLLEDINYRFETHWLLTDSETLITKALACKDFDEYYEKVMH